LEQLLLRMKTLLAQDGGTAVAVSNLKHRRLDGTVVSHEQLELELEQDMEVSASEYESEAESETVASDESGSDAGHRSRSRSRSKNGGGKSQIRSQNTVKDVKTRRRGAVRTEEAASQPKKRARIKKAVRKVETDSVAEHEAEYQSGSGVAAEGSDDGNVRVLSGRQRVQRATDLLQVPVQVPVQVPGEGVVGGEDEAEWGEDGAVQVWADDKAGNVGSSGITLPYYSHSEEEEEDEEEDDDEQEDNDDEDEEIELNAGSAMGSMFLEDEAESVGSAESDDY
jgi:hypothetical protein